jgi:pimeloyl-ACP methyl ester carboxylesterase
MHGILGSEAVWRDVVPLLAPDFDTIAPNAMGHLGGPGPAERPATLAQMIDSAERQLDELELDRPHLAGNSMGGWLALELARRGRARSVCALSPAGTWEIDWPDRQRVFALLRTAVKETKRSRWLLPLLARSKRVRRYGMQNAAVHGDRVTPAQMIELADATIGCEVAYELLEDQQEMEALDPPPCPIVLAWAEKDVLFPPDLYGARARELMPGAEFKLLEDVGHIPMLDDPRLVADAIRASARAGASVSSPDS